MSAQDWVLLLLIVVLYCVFAGWLARFSVTMPMVLVLAGAVTGPDVLGLIDIPATAAGVERVAEVTLALLLFADAATLDLGRMRHHAGLTGRLLLIGLPLTVLLGAALAFALFPNEGIGFALLIAAILAPSDAALAMPTSGSSRVPVRILRTLRIESGFNDGIAAPLVALFVDPSLLLDPTPWCSEAARPESLEQHPEHFLKHEVDQAEKRAERSCESHDDAGHVGRLPWRGPVDLLDLVLQLAEEADESLPASTQRR